MLTPAEGTAQLQQHADFMQRCTSYKNLLTNSGLPFSVDLSTLDKAYAQVLFAQLLTLDKGLKARYELLRTDEGKQKLLADTVSTAGHEVMDQVGAALTALAQAYRGISLGQQVGWLHEKYDLSQFAQYYELDLSKAINGLTISWAGREHVLAYFTNLANELTRLRGIFRPLVDTSAPLDTVLEAVSSLYLHRGRTKEPVEVDELRLHQWLLPRLEKAQVLGNIPKVA